MRELGLILDFQGSPVLKVSHHSGAVAMLKILRETMADIPKKGAVCQLHNILLSPS